MPLREDILKPIPGENPAGQNLRYSPVYDKIKEARREDDDLAAGVWQHERKIADHALAIRLAQESIATQSKDLQLAAWLTDSLLRKNGPGGLWEGLLLCQNLLEQFWDTLYPEIEEGDLEQRASPLQWIGTKLDLPVKRIVLTRDGYGYYQYKDSRKVGFEEEAKTKDQKAAREKLLKEGKLAPEVFDKSFAETPKAFYASLEKDLDGCLKAQESLNQLAQEKFGDDAPSVAPLRDALQEVRHVVHQLLQKKRELEPDPVEEAPPEPAAAVAEAPDEARAGAAARVVSPAGGGSVGGGAAVSPAMYVSAEPADRRDAIGNVFAAAAFLRQREPYSPAPYLMVRGLRWGELRASSDPAVLEAPPTEVRAHIKSLAMNNRWAELLEAAEAAMAMPCSRAWLDLQRFVVEACAALGEEYRTIAIAIHAELRALLRDLPHLLDATLSDDTPAANPQTQAWLRELLGEPENAAPMAKLLPVPVVERDNSPGWQKKFIDPHALALEAMRTGQPQKAVEILQRELDRQRSGRGRFQRKLQLAQICLAAGKDTIAQPLLDDLAATIENHKLDDWEDREMVAGALVFLLQSSKKVQGDAKIKTAFFERICRLDPVLALTV